MFSVLSLMFSVETYAQSTNYEQRLIGTWVDANGETWVFNADGTGARGTRNLKYGAINGKIVLHQGTSGVSYEYIFSQDGRTLLITNAGGTGIILQKKD
jgi:sugar lactone lactonase YvrE